MVDGYFDNSFNFQNMILKRKLVVQEKLQLANDSINTTVPNVPCCLLETELECLNRCSDVIEQELLAMFLNAGK